VADLHHWVLLHHSKGLIYTYILDGLHEVEKGIKAFEAILSRRPRLEAYYTKRLPFFPKWLWPNIFYFLGLARVKTGRFAEATDAFNEANKFKVSFLFKKRVEAGLISAQEGQTKRNGAYG
jgi:hypothetical protein